MKSLLQVPRKQQEYSAYQNFKQYWILSIPAPIWFTTYNRTIKHAYHTKYFYNNPLISFSEHAVNCQEVMICCRYQWHLMHGEAVASPHLWGPVPDLVSTEHSMVSTVLTLESTGMKLYLCLLTWPPVWRSIYCAVRPYPAVARRPVPCSACSHTLHSDY